MISLKDRMLRLAEQITPRLPGGTAADVVRTALGIGASQRPETTLPCLAPLGSMTDLSALLGRHLKPKRPPASAPGRETGRFTTHAASTPVGPYDYKLFEPEGQSAPTALVVMLHGCTQDAADFAAGTQMNAIAQRHNVLAAYPEQPRNANPTRCWNWFLAGNQRRDQGEAAAIAAITRKVMVEHGIAPGRAFVAGLSAGGAMAAIMAEAYPDLFGAVGIHSGLPSGAAHDMASAFAAMRHAGRLPADESGSLAQGVPTIVFHGDADTTVDPSNAAAILARLNARETGLTPATERGTAPSGRRYLKTTGRDGAGRIRFESWTVEGAGHAWSGGGPAGSFTDPSGPDASTAMMQFFLAQIGHTGEAAA